MYLRIEQKLAQIQWIIAWLKRMLHLNYQNTIFPQVFMRSSRFEIKDNQTVSWSVFYKLLPYLGEFKERVALAILCLILAKVASVGLPFVLKYAVDSLNEPNTVTPFLLSALALVVAYGALRFFNVILGEIRDTLFGRVTERAMRRLGLEVFQHLHTLDLTFHLNRQTGGLSRDIDRGTNGISFLMRFRVIIFIF